MPQNANVVIVYGPYDSNGIVEYKQDRLVGLQKYLEAKGHSIAELRQATNWNNVQVIVNEQTIFKCKLDDLEFGGDGELDPVVNTIESLVTKAY